MHEHLTMMAQHNKWANAHISEAIMQISEDDYMKERGSFFGSIHGTLNHLLLVDRLWHGRMIGEPYPADRLDLIVAKDRDTLIKERAEEDDILIDFVASLSPEDLEGEISYSSLIGFSSTDRRRVILAHMFNHATHHRGQAHDQLSQIPMDPPPLDLMIYLRTLD